MLGCVRLGGDVRRVRGAGHDLVVWSGHSLACHVGELLRWRWRGGFPGFVRVLRAHMAGGVLHLPLLGNGDVVVVGAGRPCLPCGVHVLIAERDVLGRVVVLGELFGRGARRAVQACPMQRDAARHVFGDLASAAAGGDRVGNVAGRAGLVERASRLRADGQIVAGWRFVLVDCDADDLDHGRRCRRGGVGRRVELVFDGVDPVGVVSHEPCRRVDGVPVGVETVLEVAAVRAPDHVMHSVGAAAGHRGRGDSDHAGFV